MENRLESEELDRTTERTIISAFGHSVIEFEPVLFHKFVIASGPGSIITEDMFRRFLVRMETRGLVASLNFFGRRAWKRLVIDSDAGIGDVAPSTASRTRPHRFVAETESEIPAPPQPERLVSESRAVAKDILETLASKIPDGHPSEDMREALRRHAEEMRRALSDSRSEFLEYVAENLPALRQRLEQLLDSKGEEVLLLGLRRVALS